jgi:hypothetical protein
MRAIPSHSTVTSRLVMENSVPPTGKRFIQTKKEEDARTI